MPIIRGWSGFAIDMSLVECGGDGDCLFHCVAAAMGQILNCQFSMLHVRNLLAQSLTYDNVTDYVTQVREEHDHCLPAGSVRLNVEYSLDIVRAIVELPGHYHQGTDGTLRWLAKCSEWFRHNQVGFVVFSSFGPSYTSVIGDDNTRHYILLFNSSETCHWQLVYLPIVKETVTWHCCITADVCAELQSVLQRGELKNMETNKHI